MRRRPDVGSISLVTGSVQGSLDEQQAVVQAEDLHRSFDGTAVWDRLSLTLRAGERLALRGASGSGKTLLMRTLVGLEPVQRGEVRAFGTRLSEWSRPELRARVMYVPQRTQLPSGTVEAAIRRPFSYSVHSDRSFPREEALEMLESFGRGESFLRQRTEDLSGGEEQIASFVRAVLLLPDVLLLDEPSASLDPTATNALEDALLQWHETTGRAFMVTSHDPAQLDRIADTSLELSSTLSSGRGDAL